jgi:hypothetical protein
MIFPQRPALALAVFFALGLQACTPAPPRTQASAAAQTACRARADQVFEQQNRGAIYREDNFVSGLRDTPFGSAGLGSTMPTNLADQFGRDRTMQDCLDGIGASGNSGAASDAVRVIQPGPPATR